MSQTTVVSVLRPQHIHPAQNISASVLAADAIATTLVSPCDNEECIFKEATTTYGPSSMRMVYDFTTTDVENGTTVSRTV